MGDVVMPAEIAYIKYMKDKGIKALILWYRAEVALLDSSRQELFSVFTDARLEECQTNTECLAKGWREARIAKRNAVAAA